MGAFGKLISYLLGFGAGLVGRYVVKKVEEDRKLEAMLREIEASVKALEARRLAIVEDEEEKGKKGKK